MFKPLSIRKRPRGRPRRRLSDPKVKEMLDYYAEGMPLVEICYEYKIGFKTLRRLINEYEQENGKKSLRKKKVIRYS